MTGQDLSTQPVARESDGDVASQPSKRNAGRPVEPGTVTNSDPANGSAVRAPASMPSHAVVRYSRSRPGPPKAGHVGRDTGVASRCSTRPSDEMRQTLNPSHIAA